MLSAARKCLSLAFALLVVLLPVFSSAQMQDRLYADEGKFYMVLPASADRAARGTPAWFCLWQDGGMTYAAICARGRVAGSMRLIVSRHGV